MVKYKKRRLPDGKKDVVIKNELLTQDSGRISFITNATVKHIADGEEKESPENGSVAVYYIKKDKKIYLFDDAFKFKKARNFYGY